MKRRTKLLMRAVRALERAKRRRRPRLYRYADLRITINGVELLDVASITYTPKGKRP